MKKNVKNCKKRKILIITINSLSSTILITINSVLSTINYY